MPIFSQLRRAHYLSWSRPLSLALFGLAIGLGSFGTAPASAAPGPVDLTLGGSFQFGGGFDVNDFEFGFVDIDVDESFGPAVFLGIPITRALQIELIAVRQPTEISIDEGPFFDDFVIGDLDLNYYHAGILWRFPIGQIEPYFALSGGVTQFEFDFPGISDETFASVSFGGGVKARFTEHIGFRLDGRFMATEIDDEFDTTGRRCRRCDEGNSMLQGFVTAGLLVSF